MNHPNKSFYFFLCWFYLRKEGLRMTKGEKFSTMKSSADNYCELVLKWISQKFPVWGEVQFHSQLQYGR